MNVSKSKDLKDDPICCGCKMERIYTGTPHWSLKGWWCRQCHRFDKAIGREKQL